MNSYLVEALHQGEVLKECLNYYTQNTDNPLNKIISLYKKNKFRKIVLSGMGSSYYAAFSVVGYLLQNDIPCSVVNSFELSRHQMGLITPDTLLVTISQSGKSLEVLELVEKAKKITSVIAFVNKEDSQLAQQSHHNVWLKAGLETQITNKSYVCTLAVLNLFASMLVEDPKDSTIEKIYQLADWADQYLKSIEKHMPELNNFVQPINSIDLMGDGPSYGSALQAGLTYREGPKIVSTASSTADYVHGWNKSIAPGYVGIIHAPVYRDDSVDAKALNNFVSNDAKVVLLTSSQVNIDKKQVFVIKHPDMPDRLATIPQIVISTTLMGWLMGEKSDRE